MIPLRRPAPAADVLRVLITTGPAPTHVITDLLGITTGQAGRALHQLRDLGHVRLEYGPGGTHVPTVNTVPHELLR